MFLVSFKAQAFDYSNLEVEYFHISQWKFSNSIGKTVIGDILYQVSPNDKKGMSFKVLLPLAPTESIKHAEKNSLSLGLEKSKSVLLVEDSSSQVELISLIFEENNISFDVVKNGLEGFDLFFQNPEKYDLVLTDNSMPEMNGIDMSKYILSEFPGTNIVLLTGDINSAVVKKCDKIGIGEIFLKPIKSDELIKLVNSYTKK